MLWEEPHERSRELRRQLQDKLVQGQQEARKADMELRKAMVRKSSGGVGLVSVGSGRQRLLGVGAAGGIKPP